MSDIVERLRMPWPVELDRLHEEVNRLRSDNARLRAMLDRLEAAYNNKEISGSLWDKEQHCYISLPVFFSRTHEQSECDGDDYADRAEWKAGRYQK